MAVRGPVFAIVTPFDSRGEIDYAALGDYLRFLEGHGVRDIVVNGTTGEFPSLTMAERIRVLEHCRRGFRGTVISHVSSCCDRDCRTLLEHARDHADAALLLPPFYYAHAGEAGCLAFLRAVLREATIPVYLYHFPEHTQMPISPEMFGVLAAEFEHLAGIKDSGGDLQVSRAFKQAAPGRQVFVGSDRGALQVLLEGLDGSVTGCGNPVPEFLVTLQERFAAGSLEAARTVQASFDGWTDFREGLPVKDLPMVKAALGARVPGFPPYVRPPFLTAEPDQIAVIHETMRDQSRARAPDSYSKPGGSKSWACG